MGKYTPAVIVHDLAPAHIEGEEWLRCAHTSAGESRVFVCDTSPHEVSRLTRGWTMDRVRLVALGDVSWQRLARLANVDGQTARRVLSVLMRGGDEVYKIKRGYRR